MAFVTYLASFYGPVQGLATFWRRRSGSPVVFSSVYSNLSGPTA